MTTYKNNTYNLKKTPKDLPISVKGSKKLSRFKNIIIIISTIIIKNFNGNSELFFFLHFIEC